MKARTLAAPLLALALLAGCANHPMSSDPLTVPSNYPTIADSTGADPTAVTYKVASNGTKAVITYTDEGGSIEQATDAKLPWVLTVSDPDMLAQVSAQDSDGTEITCLIVDSAGKVLAGHTATGPYAIVSCQH